VGYSWQAGFGGTAETDGMGSHGAGTGAARETHSGAEPTTKGNNN